LLIVESVDLVGLDSLEVNSEKTTIIS
jgi:hypothetical protein